MKKVLLLTHIDLDGYGCAVVLKRYSKLFGFELSVLHVDYGFETNSEVQKLIMSYDVVYFTDISFSEDFAKKLDMVMKYMPNKHYLLYDHHTSSKSKLEPLGYDWILVDESRCGTKILYEVLLDQVRSFDSTKAELLSSLDDFVTLVNDYDLWKHKDPRSRQLQYLWSGYPDKKLFIDRFSDDPEFLLSLDEAVIVNKSVQNFNDSYNLSMTTLKVLNDKDGYRFGICKKGLLYSLVADSLLKELTELDYLVLVDGYNLSFRSLKVKVSDIAESLGGGGHPLSAGASLPALSDIDNSVINRKVVMLSFISSQKLRNIG